MAAGDAQAFPIRNKPDRAWGLIRSTASSEPITGGLTGLACLISKDGADFAASTHPPVEIGTSGFFTIDLTAAEMDCYLAIIHVSATNANQVSWFFQVYPLQMQVGAFTGGPTRFEHYLKATKLYLWNLVRRNNDLVQVYDDDDVTLVAQASLVKSGSITDKTRLQ